MRKVDGCIREELHQTGFQQLQIQYHLNLKSHHIPTTGADCQIRDTQLTTQNTDLAVPREHHIRDGGIRDGNGRLGIVSLLLQFQRLLQNHRATLPNDHLERRIGSCEFLYETGGLFEPQRTTLQPRRQLRSRLILRLRFLLSQQQHRGSKSESGRRDCQQRQQPASPGIKGSCSFHDDCPEACKIHFSQ